MREILFRGRRRNGEWIEGNYIFWSKKHCIYDGIYYEVLPETVSEFTSLCDKNGKKIFEGDVVIDRYSKETFGFVGVVIYNSQLSQFQIFNEKQPGYVVNLGSRIQSVRIIGNIHDNPELLRKEDEGK